MEDWIAEWLPMLYGHDALCRGCDARLLIEVCGGTPYGKAGSPNEEK
jgi:hypothetical protein